jgi:hypothetical protein
MQPNFSYGSCLTSYFRYRNFQHCYNSSRDWLMSKTLALALTETADPSIREPASSPVARDDQAKHGFLKV